MENCGQGLKSSGFFSTIWNKCVETRNSARELCAGGVLFCL
ncbi:hypothetical protein CLOSTASPAR_02302 [[Clostridium] asparagiforme DSM 15981]|uniref:Uncharacterized protein n=1 Tax=[Clostridium] asparagiforme DSM 15981 TaxID=518636 RepID=C0CZ76_9FIRM|nr:hypothetical protein CLOSTASPAR_02302 [[Clostridium] asparagiforme DSM 15981]